MTTRVRHAYQVKDGRYGTALCNGQPTKVTGSPACVPCLAIIRKETDQATIGALRELLEWLRPDLAQPERESVLGAFFILSPNWTSTTPSTSYESLGQELLRMELRDHGCPACSQGGAR